MDIDREVLSNTRKEIMSWSWPKNGPHKSIAWDLASEVILGAVSRSCTKEGVKLKRGQYRFIAKDFYDERGITSQSFKTICAKLADHNIISFQHQTMKRATIATVCNFNSYASSKPSTINKTSTKHKQSMKEPTNLIGTHDNNNNNGFIKINKFYTPSGGTPARAGAQVVSDPGKPPVFAEIAEISKDSDWINAIADKYKIGAEAVVAMFGLFRQECVANGKTAHSGENFEERLTDCKAHFHSWLRIQLKNKSKAKAVGSVAPKHDGVVVHYGDIPTKEENEDYQRRAMAAVEALR